MVRFHRKYFFAAVLLLFVEILIAGFIQDEIVRPYGGDYLVVIFLYCLLRSFWRISVRNAVFVVLAFSFIVEILQYFSLVNLLRLENNSLFSTVLGNHFDFLDLFIYVLSALTIIVMEAFRKPPQREKVPSNSQSKW